MAGTLLSYVVSDLCLGKPSLRSLPVTSTVSDALAALKTTPSEDSSISLWSCRGTTPDDQRVKIHNGSSAVSYVEWDGGEKGEECRCVGKICMVDIVCYLCREENVGDPVAAMETPVAVVVGKAAAEGAVVNHVEPDTSLLEAMDLILQGVQNLVIPLHPSKPSHHHAATFLHHHHHHDFCWLTQNDIVSFLITRISLFAPLSTLPISDLNLIDSDFLALGHHFPASAALDLVSHSIKTDSSIAILDDNGYLISDISPRELWGCDETLAGAFLTLSASDLVTFLDSGSDDLIRIIRSRLRHRKLDSLLSFLFDDECSVSVSSEDDVASTTSSSSGASDGGMSGRWRRSGSGSWREGRMPVVCGSGSSMIAVMMQAMAHRVSYVWVVDDDGGLVGGVRFRDVIEVFRDQVAAAMGDEWGDL